MKISTREKRFLMAGGLAVVAYLTAVYLIEPLIASQLGVREEIEKRTALLERHQFLASEKDRYRRRVEAARAQVSQAEALLFKGEKLPLLAAEIQGLFHKLGDETGISIFRENVPPPKKLETLTQVTVELSVRGEMRAIRDFLYRIQTSRQLLTIPKLTIRGSTSRAQPALSADLQVAGYTTGGEERATGVRAGPERK